MKFGVYSDFGDSNGEGGGLRDIWSNVSGVLGYFGNSKGF